jgi:hypothetical protein
MDAFIEALFQAVLSEEDKSDRHRQVKSRILEAEGAIREWTKPTLIDPSNERVLLKFRDRLRQRVERGTGLDEADLDCIIRNFIAGEYDSALRVVAFNAAEGWSRDVSEDIAGEIMDRAYDADETLTEGTKRFIDRHIDQERRPPARRYWAKQISRPARRREDGIDFADWRFNTGAMGVRTRGLDIKAGAGPNPTTMPATAHETARMTSPHTRSYRDNREHGPTFLSSEQEKVPPERGNHLLKERQDRSA